MPSTWDEVHLLQEALGPSIRSFSRIASRSPPVVLGSTWLSYASQLDILQRESDRCWRADRRPGAPPKLAGLNSWRGGISMVGTAGFHITEEMTKEFMHAKLRRYWHLDRSSSSQQERYVKRMHDNFQEILRAADARKEKFGARTAERNAERDDSEEYAAMLDRIVARDPERYLAWLLSVGYFYFTTSDHNPSAFAWEEWCTWKAPKCFELSCKPASAVRRPQLGPGAIDRTKYGPLGDRPTITLEEAQKSYTRAMKSQNSANGMEVSQKEKAQYSMIGGKATSREAAVHHSAIRKEDVWLFQPMGPLGEAYNDPSRRREAELEASFGCWR